MHQSVLPGFELLVMAPQEVMDNYHKAETEGEINEMILKVCYEAQNKTVSDAQFRQMISKLITKKADILEERMPTIRL